jgi:predicted Ser/Thr protein kinase
VAPELGGGCPRCVAELLKSRTGDVSGEAREDDAPPLAAGDSLGRFEVLEYLGRGGMGFVYRARQKGLERVVALKVLAPRLAASPEFAARFDREARALASLNHPNIVGVHDYGEENGLYFLAMEFVDGTSLRRILSSQKISPETALRYVPQICEALEYAHSRGVIHRDIKPENILIDKRGNLKIADFGLAKMVAREAASPDAPTAPAGHATLPGQVMGTPHYMAPEQVENLAAVDHRADIYSLGVVFYEMLTGELPLGRFPAPSQRVGVDVRFDEVVLRALQKEPEKRYQRASEVRDDVTMISSAEAGTAGAAPRAARPRLSRLAFCGVLGLPAAIVTFVLLGALCVLFGGRFHDEEAAAAAVVSGLVALTGVSLSIAGLVAVRRSSGRLRGGVLAVLGVLLPVGLVPLVLGLAAVMWFYKGYRDAELRQLEMDQRRAYEKAKRQELEGIKKQRIAEGEVRAVWQRLRDQMVKRAGTASPAELAELVEPSRREKLLGWPGLSAEEQKELKTQSGVFGIRFDEIPATPAADFFKRAKVVEVKLDGDAAEMVLEFRKKHLSVPFRRVEGSWFFAPAAVPDLAPAGDAELAAARVSAASAGQMAATEKFLQLERQAAAGRATRLEVRAAEVALARADAELASARAAYAKLDDEEAWPAAALRAAKARLKAAEARRDYASETVQLRSDQVKAGRVTTADVRAAEADLAEAEAEVTAARAALTRAEESTVVRSAEVRIRLFRDEPKGPTLCELPVAGGSRMPLAEALKKVLAMKKAWKDARIVIAAHEDIPYADVTRLLDACRKAGLKRISFSAPVRGPGKPPEAPSKTPPPRTAPTGPVGY